MAARGELDAARAELDLRQRRYDSLEKLLVGNHARPEEVERSRADLAIAKANLIGAEERRQLKKLEYERIVRQLDMRTITAPITGWVTAVTKEPGEYVGPNDPVVCTIVQLDPILINFNLPRARATALKAGEKVQIRFTDSAKDAAGDVEYVSRVIDAESGTIAVRVVVANRDGVFQSGERCQLLDGKGLALDGR